MVNVHFGYREWTEGRPEDTVRRPHLTLDIYSARFSLVRVRTSTYLYRASKAQDLSWEHIEDSKTFVLAPNAWENLADRVGLDPLSAILWASNFHERVEAGIEDCRQILSRSHLDGHPGLTLAQTRLRGCSFHFQE